MANTTLPTAYSSGHFELRIDEQTGDPTYLKSVEGGYPKQKVVNESTGGHLLQMKHQGVWEIDPITVDVGMSTAHGILSWIKQSWQRKWSPRGGQITHANFDKKSQFIQEFKRALITETTFPELDGSSNKGAYLKVKFQPEEVELTRQPNGPMISGVGGTKQKNWASSSFRLSFDDNKIDATRVNKIESFTIKQNVKMFYGNPNEKFPTLTPTNIVFPNIVFYLAESYSGSMFDWYNRVLKSNESDGRLTGGQIEYLSPQGKTMFELRLDDIGLVSVQLPTTSAGEAGIKRVRVEMHVGAMDIKGKGAGMG